MIRVLTVCIFLLPAADIKHESYSRNPPRSCQAFLQAVAFPISGRLIQQFPLSKGGGHKLSEMSEFHSFDNPVTGR
jgi:hypothetical protein